MKRRDLLRALIAAPIIPVAAISAREVPKPNPTPDPHAGLARTKIGDTGLTIDWLEDSMDEYPNCHGTVTYCNAHNNEEVKIVVWRNYPKAGRLGWHEKTVDSPLKHGWVSTPTKENPFGLVEDLPKVLA